jgi:hypothetical protein
VCKDDAVLLVDEVTRDVTAWIGADCGVFAASLAKQVSHLSSLTNGFLNGQINGRSKLQ